MNYELKNRYEIEEYIIQCILSESGSNNDVLRKITIEYNLDSVDYFKKNIHKEVFRISLYVLKRDIKITIPTLMYYKSLSLKNSEKPFYDLNDYELVLMLLKFPYLDSNKLHDYTLILKEYLLKDYWNEKSNDVLNNSWDDRDIFDVSDNIIGGYNLLFNKLTANSKKETQAEDKMRADWEKKKSGLDLFVPYPVENLNKATKGLRAPDLIVMAGRPGMGKTTIAFIISYYASFIKGFKVIFFSLEMSKEQIINRIVSRETGFSYDKIKDKNFVDDNEFEIYLNKYREIEKNQNFIIYDQTEIRTLRQIKNKIKEDAPSLVIIDYLQLIKLDKGDRTQSREQDISTISRELKSSCVENSVPIIALSQLSRKVEERHSNKRPMLSDLRESGAIEQDADIVVFFYRDAYYLAKNPAAIIADYEHGNTEFIIAKGRELKIGTQRIWVDLENFKMEEGFKEVSNVGYLVEHPDEPPPPPKTVL